MKILMLLILCLALQAPPQPVTAPDWVVVFEIKQPKPLDPVARINVLVRGNSEGDAAVAAYRYLEMFFSDMSKLSFSEACQKK